MFRTRVSLAALLVAAALAGCSTGGSSDAAGTAPVAAAGGDGRCSASGADFTVGKPGTPELLEQARKASGAQIGRASDSRPQKNPPMKAGFLLQRPNYSGRT